MFAPVFAALAIFLALAESPSPEPPPTPAEVTQEKKEVRSNENENAQPTQPPANEIAPTINQLRASPIEQNRQSHSGKNSDESSFNYWYACAITILTVALVIFAWLQLRATKDAIVPAKQSADAAMLNAETNRISNRAKVAVEKLVFYDVNDATRTTIRFVYKVKNTGKTTAHIYERLDTVQIIENPLPDGPPTLQGAPKMEPFDLAPDRDDVNFIGGAFEKSGLDMTKFAQEKAELYAVGVIKYRDDFGSEWTTGYAWQYRRTGPAFFVQQAGYDNPA